MMNTVRIQERTDLRLMYTNAEGKKNRKRSNMGEALTRRLCSATGCNQALLAPTPALAMARAVSLARAYGMAKHGKDCTGILVLTCRDFDLWLANAEGFSRAKPQDPAALGEMLDGTVCAVVFSFWEPGQPPMSSAYVKDLFYLCRSAGVLLISDETALGLGRTGALLAWESYGKRPDLTVTALGGNLGACLLRGGLAAEPEQGGPEGRDCAEAMASLDALLAPGALNTIADTGRYLKSALSLLPGVTDVQGLGLALSAAVEGEAVSKLAGASLPALTLTAQGDGVLLAPSLAAGKSELAQCLALLCRILRES